MERTKDIKRLVEAFEQERDKLLDQVQYLKGHSERIEWVIKVMNSQVAQIEQEENQKIILQRAQEQALQAAREKGNVGAHPSYSERSADLAARRDAAIVPPEATPEEKKKKLKKE